MKKAYVSPEAVKVNFEANDIITVSGMLTQSNWEENGGWAGAMSLSWTDLIS